MTEEQKKNDVDEESVDMDALSKSQETLEEAEIEEEADKEPDAEIKDED